jgi:hypothetical protein
LAEDFFGMRGEGEDERIEAAFLSSLDEETQNLLVSQVKAVKVPNGYRHGATKRRQMVKPFEDVHVFNA